MYFRNLLQVGIPSTEAGRLLDPRRASPPTYDFVLSVQ